MEGEAFDSFKAPQFVDFSEIHDETVDTFFDVVQENQPKSETKSVKSRLSSNDEYFSPLAFQSIIGDNNEADPLEHSFEESEGCPKLRKSMSVGNLIMFSEEEYREEYKSNLDEICEDVQNLNISHNEEEQKEQTSLDSNKSNLCKGNNQSLYRKVSQDYLNKLAQPKRYASVENLKQGNAQKFVSLAEAVSLFQNRTPVRFRSKPNLHRQASQTLSTTVPESPALQTKTRNRPGQRVLSHEEREQIEFENLQKFKIKAHPVNKKVLQGPVKPMAPLEKKNYTIPKPFKLSAVPSKKTTMPEQKFEFHAKPVPRSAEKPRRTQELQRREPTKPITPSFMKNYKPPNRKVEMAEQQKKVGNQDEYPLKSTIPIPFSFEARNQMVQKKREELIQKIREEERRAREFHAKPMPKIYKRCDSARSDSCSSDASSKKYKSSSENLSTQFKARPPLVLYKEPFVPAKADKPPTKIVPFQLESDLRWQEREQFEREKRQKEEKLELLKRAQEEERARKEQEEIAQIRKEAEYKAQPIKKYKDLIIQPSGKVTQPISPKFHCNGLRQTKNKENIADNSNNTTF